MLTYWDIIFKVAVKKKQRKIILSKDELSIDYNVKNRRELILPPEYYLDLTELEKHFFEKYHDKFPDWEFGILRMYLSRRYEIRSDLIHLSSIADFCRIDMADLFKKKFKPLENKLLTKVKKRLKLRSLKKKAEEARQKRLRSRSLIATHINGASKKVRSHALQNLVIQEELPSQMEEIKENDEEEEKISNLSDHQSERISILDLIVIINDKVKDLSKAFNVFAKKNKQNKGFMNIFCFNSFMGVELGLKLTSSNKKGLFTVIDWNDDGYCTEKEFSIVLGNTKEDIEQAIKDPMNYKKGLLLDFVIEQIYHDIIMFKQSSVDEITEKLDKNGRIEVNRLAKYLSFYGCIVTPIEIDILAGTGVEDPKTGNKMVPFRKLIAKSMSRINIRINFRPSYKKMQTSIGKEVDRKNREK